MVYLTKDDQIHLNETIKNEKLNQFIDEVKLNIILKTIKFVCLVLVKDV